LPIFIDKGGKQNMATEWNLDQEVEKMISTNDSELLASYRFALYRESVINGSVEYIPMGLLQDITLQEYRMTQPIKEIGSLVPIYLPGPFQGSISLNKVLVFNEGIIAATHNDVSKLEMDLLQTFGKTTNFILVAFDPKEADLLNDITGFSASIVGKSRIEKAKIQDKSLNVSAGQPVVIESATFLFTKIEDIA
jgi:hypothetical protein